MYKKLLQVDFCKEVFTKTKQQRPKKRKPKQTTQEMR
jgi:hypothetical protein